jgi:ribonuclease VapC
LIARPGSVLDASALLCYLQDEPGSDAVREALIATAAMSVVNLAEVLSRLTDLGQKPDTVLRYWRDQGLLGQSLLVYDLDLAQARRIALFRPPTRSLGLPLADRACLVLAHHLNLPVLTTDRSWKKARLRPRVIPVR